MKRNFNGILAWMFLLGTVLADTVIQQSGKTEAEVKAITTESIKLADNSAIPSAGISSIIFSRGSVVAQPQMLLFTDGSVLSGTLHDIKTAEVQFRSTSLGPVVMPLSTVAAVCFSRDVVMEEIKTAQSSEKTLVMLKNGQSKEGVIFAVSESRLAMRTERGLEQMAKTDLLYISFRKAASVNRIQLRNGDRLNMPVEWKGSKFVIKIGDSKTAVLPIESLKMIQF